LKTRRSAFGFTPHNRSARHRPHAAHLDSGIEWPIKIIIRRQTGLSARIITSSPPPVVILCVRTPKPRWRRRLMLRNVSISFARVDFAQKPRAVLYILYIMYKYYITRKYIQYTIYMHIYIYILRRFRLTAYCQCGRVSVYTNSFLRQQYVTLFLLSAPLFSRMNLNQSSHI